MHHRLTIWSTNDRLTVQSMVDRPIRKSSLKKSRKENTCMKEYKLAKLEARFADLIWQREPISSPELVKLCEKEFDWKKSTTYTVLKKLCDRGIFQNEDAIVTSLVTRDEFYGHKSREFVEDSFGGSIPKFLTAFMGGKKLTEKQAAEIKELIDNFTE